MAVNDGEPKSREGELPRRPWAATVGLVLGILGGVAMAFGVLLYALEPTLLPLALGNVLFGVAGVTFYAVTHRQNLGRAFRGRSTPLLLLEGVIALGVVAAVVVANLAAAAAKKEWDLTRDQLFTLQPQSMTVAQRLKDPVTVYAFFQSTDPAVASLRETIRLYRQHTNLIELEVLNPDRIPPETIERFELSSKSEKIVLEGPKRYTKIRQGSEEQITNALLRLLERPSRQVGYLVGHREPDPDSKQDEDAFGEATAALRAEGYQVEPVDLQERLTGVEMLLVVKPSISLLPAELQVLKDFLLDGGRLYALLDPLHHGGLSVLLEPLGVRLGDNLVVSPSPEARAVGFSEATPVVRNYEAHPITGPLQGQVTVFHLVQSVSPVLGAAGVVTLLQSAETAWAEADPRGTPPFTLDRGDEPGPVPMAVAVETDPFGSPAAGGPVRIVVFGDSDFASNRMITLGANRDLFTNGANWLLGEEDRVTIRPKRRAGDRLPLTEMQHFGIMFFSVNLMPLLILGFGFSVWALRRRQ